MVAAWTPPDLSALPYYFVDGACNGAVFALIALGYTLVYGIIKLINFAHGEFYMLGAYCGFGVWLLVGTRVPIFISVPLVLLTAALSGAAVAVATERVAYRPIRGRSRLIALLTAIGVSLTLQNLFKFVGSGRNQVFGGQVYELLKHSVKVGGNGIAVFKFVVLIITIVLMLFLWYLVMRTRFGRAMRATSQDLDAARLMGINVDRVIMLTFALGGFFAGIAGVLNGALYQINPTMGFMPGLIAFVAAVIGGIGSIPGAVIGGFLIGILRSVVVWGGVPTSYQDVAVFILLIVGLVMRPQGILGKREREKV